MTVRFRPLADRVLVSRDETPEKIGSIEIPQAAREKPIHGEIMAAGPGAYEGDKFIEMRLKVGDKVLFGKYGGVEVVLDGKEYVILREGEILGVLESVR